MMAAIIKTNERIDEIQPSDAIWNLPGKLYVSLPTCTPIGSVVTVY